MGFFLPGLFCSSDWRSMCSATLGSWQIHKGGHFRTHSCRRRRSDHSLQYSEEKGSIRTRLQRFTAKKGAESRGLCEWLSLSGFAVLGLVNVWSFVWSKSCSIYCCRTSADHNLDWRTKSRTAEKEMQRALISIYWQYTGVFSRVSDVLLSTFLSV